MDSEENAAADASETSTAAAKEAATPASSGRKRGRPPKVKTAQPSEVPNLIIDGTLDTPTTALPKKRGRKSLAELAKEAVSDSTSPPISPSSEKRGRLSTWAYAEYSDGPESDEDDDHYKKTQRKQNFKATPTTGSGKKRGRPPKNTPKETQSAEVKKMSSGKRGRPPKKRSLETSDEKSSTDQGALNNGTLKKNDSQSEKSDSDDASKAQLKGTNESGQIITEKRQRGRPRKSDKSDPRKWNDVSSPQTGRYTVPLPVPDSWPLVCNREEIMKELSEMYTNVKDEKLGEFHNQIKAFVFALHWEDGSFSTS